MKKLFLLHDDADAHVANVADEVGVLKCHGRHGEGGSS